MHYDYYDCIESSGRRAKVMAHKFNVILFIHVILNL